MPIDEAEAQRSRARGMRAEQLLNNELLTEAFEVLEKSYIEAWRSTPFNDIPGREKLFLAVNVVGKVKDHLSCVVANGKMSAKELQDLANEVARAAERRKRFGIV